MACSAVKIQIIVSFLQSLKRKAVAAAGDAEAEMEPALDAALIQLADDFISGAVAFGSGLARRRKSSKLDAADVAVFLEQTWYSYRWACKPLRSNPVFRHELTQHSVRSHRPQKSLTLCKILLKY